jgi:outer membrane lipoprotein SlyB
MAFVMRFVKQLGLTAVASAVLFGCTPDYSPNTYDAEAVQQATKVEPGVVIGFRQVAISANGTVGAITGGAAGGILGAGTNTPALGALGGSVVGGVVGSAMAHASGDTTGWEYIVREPNSDLLSVTQREPTPIPIGQKVLVITGKQARIVPDYSTAFNLPPEVAPNKDNLGKKDTPATSLPVVTPSQPPSEPNDSPPPVPVSSPPPAGGVGDTTMKVPGS